MHGRYRDGTAFGLDIQELPPDFRIKCSFCGHAIVNFMGAVEGQGKLSKSRRADIIKVPAPKLYTMEQTITHRAGKVIACEDCADQVEKPRPINPRDTF